jgi:gliding motility-associated-like protein
MIAVIAPEMPAQISLWGGSVAGWEANVQEMKDFIDDRCVAISEGLKDCYDLTGPFDITVDVQPVGSGDVKVNSLELSNYIWSGSYYGGIQNLFKAIPAAGYVFDYWELANHNMLPDATSDTAYIEDLTQNEQIIAHFRLEDQTPTEPPVVYTGLSGVVVPNAFSPNNDGNNDLLQLFVGSDVESFTFRLYDRWGHQMWEASTQSATFDGYVKGKLLNTGVFAYSIDISFKDDKPDAIVSGNVTLMR